MKVRQYNLVLVSEYLPLAVILSYLYFQSYFLWRWSLWAEFSHDSLQIKDLDCCILITFFKLCLDRGMKRRKLFFCLEFDTLTLRTIFHNSCLMSKAHETTHCYFG